MNRETPFSLSGRIALVTGGAGWLGSPIVEGLCRAGAHVVFVGRTRKTLEALKQSLDRENLSSEFFVADVTKMQNIEELLGHIEASFGKLNIFVSNSYSSPVGDVGLRAPPQLFLDSIDRSILPTWNLITRGLHLFEKASSLDGGASIINISSMYGKVSPDPKIYEATGQPINPAFYGVAKAGLMQLTRWLAMTLGGKNIRVNTVSPGPFPRILPDNQPADFIDRLGQKTAFGRVGDRREIAGPVVFLASDESSFVTGTDLAVDGGWTVQ